MLVRGGEDPLWLRPRGGPSSSVINHGGVRPTVVAQRDRYKGLISGFLEKFYSRVCAPRSTRETFFARAASFASRARPFVVGR